MESDLGPEDIGRPRETEFVRYRKTIPTLDAVFEVVLIDNVGWHWRITASGVRLAGSSAAHTEQAAAVADFEKLRAAMSYV